MPAQRKKHICIISLSRIAHDARVLRQINALAPQYQLTVIGYGDKPSLPVFEAIEWHSVETPRYIPDDIPSSLLGKIVHASRKTALYYREGRLWSALANRILPFALTLQTGRVFHSLYEKWYWSHPAHRQAYEYARACNFDLYYANDWNTLPLAAKCATQHGAKLIFDAHEYAPLEMEDRWRWRLAFTPMIRYFLHKYTPAVAGSITVSPAIAKRYAREYPLQPIVIVNAPSPVPLPEAVVDPEHISLIHHGGAVKLRKLETLIETMHYCDQRFTLHFMFVGGEAAYLRGLKDMADALAPGRIFFHDPVPPAKIVETIAKYDMGFYLLPPTIFNNAAALPNKLFDFIHAGLAICTGPTPAMAQIVQEQQCGCVATSFEPRDVARMLNNLTPDQLLTMKHGARKAAAVYNADEELAKLVAMIDAMLV